MQTNKGYLPHNWHRVETISNKDYFPIKDKINANFDSVSYLIAITSKWH
jgi:UDP-N-acetylmuramyl pentapeptide synthase